MIGSASAVFVGLLVGGLIFILSAKWDMVLCHAPMFVAGTIFFLFPGALLKREQLWYFQARTENIAISAIVLSIVCVTVGYVVVGWNEKNVSQRYTRPHSRGSLHIPTGTLFCLFVCCGLIKVLLDSDTVFASHLLVIPVGRNAGVWAKVLSQLAYAPVAAGCLTPWMWRNAQTKSRTTKLLMLGFVVLGLFSLSRTPAFYVLGTLLLFWLWENRSKWGTSGGRLLLLASVGLLLPLMIFLGAFVKGSNLLSERVSGDEASESTLTDVYNFAVEEQYTIAISDTYGNLLFAIDHYPQPYDYQPTLSLASIVTAVIPRAWFPSKGYTPSYVLTSEIFGAGTFEATGNSLATSFVGELWMNCGWVAVVLGSFALGLVGGAFRRLGSINWDGSYSHILFLMSLVAFFVTPRGDMFSTTLRGCMYIGMAWLVAKLLILFARRAHDKSYRRTIRPYLMGLPQSTRSNHVKPCAS